MFWFLLHTSYRRGSCSECSPLRVRDIGKMDKETQDYARKSEELSKFPFERKTRQAENDLLSLKESTNAAAAPPRR